MHTHIDVTAFKKILDLNATDPSLDFINVCTTSEYDGMHIDGVRSVPLDTLGEHLDEFKSKKTIYIHCMGGRRSLQAIEILEGLGVSTELINIDGGILAWVDAGFSIQP
ncbi:MAG: rhodanese-like domain-containing protein [Minisyncoccia bacterium]